MPGYGNFKVQDCYAGIQAALAGKVLSNTVMAAAIQRTVWELSGSYGMQGLQAIGPFIRLQAANSMYLPSFFMNTADAALDLRMVNSFFMYYSPGISNPPPFAAIGTANAGVQLTYRSVNSLENNLNITSIPRYWTRHAGNIYIAPVPQYNYLCYMRYQKEHPFTKPVIADTDPLFFDDDWQDIIEYAAAYRIALATRLSDYAQQMRTILYGDPKAVDAGGRRIDLGLIYSRVSQFERDVTTTMRSLQKRSA